jgi:FAD/FMN-containing dehydrogenase
LGAITRLNFRTFPLPETSGGHLACFPDANGALRFRNAVEKSGLPLANLEILSPSLSGMLAAILKRTTESYPQELNENFWSVYCYAEGSEAVVRRIGHDLQNISKETAAKQSRTLQTTENEALGGMLREAYEWLRWASSANVLCRLALPTVKPESLVTLSRFAETQMLRAVVLVRPAGIVYFATLADSEDESNIEKLTKIAEAVRSLAHKEDGHSTLLHAPLAVKEKLVKLNPSQIDRSLQLRVKRAFDPSAIFAPGRVVGVL